ncbi:unnamed protein product, partial [Phaedon cochleariae]
FTYVLILAGNKKCREDWIHIDYERTYNIFLDVILLVIPLIVLGVTYSLITRTLCKGMRIEKPSSDAPNPVNLYVNLQGTNSTRSSCRNFIRKYSSRQHLQQNWSQESSSPLSGSRKHPTSLRRTNAERSLLNKRRVIKMLFAVVLEFFICWTPLYVINTIALFDASIIYNSIGYTGVSFFQLLAYTSSCCNPITCLRKYTNSSNHGHTGSEMNMDTKWSNRLSERT